MSYADVASRGPKQSNAEKMPDYVPEIEHSDSGVHSLDSLTTTSSGSNNFPSYADQQLESERNARAHEEAKREADELAAAARDFTAHADEELARLEKESGKRYSEFTEDAKKKYQEWKKNASKEFEKMKKEGKKDAKRAEAEAKKAGRWADDNKDNPVVIGNAIVIAALGGLLGVGAYRLHQQNQLTWKVAGAWAGVVGLFAVGDYYVSQYFFKKYPPKQ